ncbi:MAG TPA: cysteine synthase family protein [Bacilli bacterium]|jgi:cysteine synthase A|nr:cysteine synthase family protein [Bacilli bacterium]
MIYNHITELIGNTPHLRLPSINNNQLYVKLEMFNPGGSVKDRIALSMVNDLVERGLLNGASKVVEATSGNTGIGLSFVLASKGISFTAVMPENMSRERVDLFRAYGTHIILTPAALGMTGAIAKAKEMEQEGYVYIDQFRNHANPEAHMKTTAEEILRDFPKLDYLVLGVGTGGTLTGLARIIRKRYPNLKIIAVEPFESSVLQGLPKGPHKIQGIGAGFVPPLLETKEVDRIISIASADAMNKAKLLARQGLFLGISSAAAILASEIVADQVKNAVILTVAPDGGAKYISTGAYEN